MLHVYAFLYDHTHSAHSILRATYIHTYVPAVAVALSVVYWMRSDGGKLRVLIPAGTSVVKCTSTVPPSTPVKTGSFRPTNTTVPSVRESKAHHRFNNEVSSRYKLTSCVHDTNKCEILVEGNAWQLTIWKWWQVNLKDFDVLHKDIRWSIQSEAHTIAAVW